MLLLILNHTPSYVMLSRLGGYTLTEVLSAARMACHSFQLVWSYIMTVITNIVVPPYAYRHTWGPRCQPQTDCKLHEEETGNCIPYVRRTPVKREIWTTARPNTPESSTERTETVITNDHIMTVVMIIPRGRCKQKANKRVRYIIFDHVTELCITDLLRCLNTKGHHWNRKLKFRVIISILLLSYRYYIHNSNTLSLYHYYVILTALCCCRWKVSDSGASTRSLSTS